MNESFTLKPGGNQDFIYNNTQHYCNLQVNLYSVEHMCDAWVHELAVI